MSEFVNYNKRGVELPKGCKNLSDLLQKVELANQGGETLVKIAGTSILAPLSAINNYVLMVFVSPNFFTLEIISQPEELKVDIAKIDGVVEASATVQYGTAHESAVRLFFENHGLILTSDSEVPVEFNPDLPWQISFDILPMPSAPSVLSHLVANLFRRVCGLKDETEMRIRYRELVNFP